MSIQHDDATPSSAASQPTNDASHDHSRSALSCRLTEQRMSSTEIVTLSTVDDSTVIFATRHFSTRYSSSTHLCDTSLVDTLLVVNRSVRHVTRRHVIRHQPIVRNATTASTLHYGPSNHRQCQVDRSSITWYRSVRHAVARTTTIAGSTTDKPSLDPTPAKRHRLHYKRQDSHCQRAASATSHLNTTQTSSTACITELTTNDK